MISCVDGSISGAGAVVIDGAHGISSLFLLS